MRMCKRWQYKSCLFVYTSQTRKELDSNNTGNWKMKQKIGVCLQVWALLSTPTHSVHTHYMPSPSPKCLPYEKGPLYRGCTIRRSLTGPKAASPLNTHESNLGTPCAAGLEVIGEWHCQDPDIRRICSAN